MRVPTLLLVMVVAALRPGAARAQQPAGPAAAPPADAKAEARALFQQGATLAKDGRWRDAIDAFERSAAHKPHATTTYNLAYCERALGNKTRAWRLFGRALEEDAARGAELAPELAEAARFYRSELEPELARLVVTVRPIDAAVAVDGRPIEIVAPAAGGDRPLAAAGTRDPGRGDRAPAAAFDLVLDPGLHTFSVARAGARPRDVGLRVELGAPRALALEAPELIASPSASVPASVHEAPNRAGGNVQRTWAYAIGAAGGAALAGGVVATFVARSTWQDALDACPARTACPNDRGADLSQRAHTEATVATIALVGGGAAIAGAVVLFLTSSPRTRKALVRSAVAGREPAPPGAAFAPAIRF